MFEVLVEAAKQGQKKGLYILTYDSVNNSVHVLDRRTDEVNFIIYSDDVQMQKSTLIYFGYKEIVKVLA